MAGEITLSFKLACSKNGTTVSNATQTKTQTMESTLSNMFHETYNLTNSELDVPTGAVVLTNQHYIFLRNADLSAVDFTRYVSVKVRKDVTPTDTDFGVMLLNEGFGPVRMKAQSGGYPKLRFVASVAGPIPVEVIVVEAGDPTV